MNYNCDIEKGAYNKAWFLAHPGYAAEHSKKWRDDHPGRPTKPGRLSRLYLDLENWRARCKRSGVVPPPESYWKNRKTKA
jgi:hypothetical protein